MAKVTDHLMLIDGELTASASGEWMESENPASAAYRWPTQPT